ncbi:hypothetical protein SORBI_3003G068500 [Sorghum bicolor]|uniref:Leucine-rich repeat-containing N-terminal plant-type domain-containing protein n=1 Tax=Sorghum bicolor TaxID=4558 RepID=C5XPW9_SORBI|nr:hypothetical protein SORBI_3003G068500 [Sorghum bicolor]
MALRSLRLLILLLLLSSSLLSPHRRRTRRRGGGLAAGLEGSGDQRRQVLDFSATGIWGSIPSAIGNLVGLESLGDNDASISGVLPDSIGKLGNLTSNLSGQIPSSIGNLSKLTILTAFSSNLEGFRRS